MSIPSDNSQAQPALDQKQADKEMNFARLRQQVDQEKQARMHAEQRLAQLEQERAQPRQEDDSDTDDVEAYVDRKALRKEISKGKEEIRREFKTAVQQEAKVLIDQERQNSFLKQNSDFHQILNPELIQKFAEKYPDVAEPMLEMPDTFARQKLLYQNIKALGLHRPPVEQKPIQETVDKNRRSPYYQPSMAGNTPPYAAAGDYSDAGQKNAYAKMKDLIKNRRTMS